MPTSDRFANPPLRQLLVGGLVLLGVILAAVVIWRPVKVHVTVDTRPTGGAVVLADHYCPAAPCDFELAPGEYKVQANLLNYQKVETTVDVTEGDPTAKTIRLLPMVPTPEEAQRLHLMRLPDKPGGTVEKANGKN
jgi:hypothetical protein